jgi:hypothetical protein
MIVAAAILDVPITVPPTKLLLLLMLPLCGSGNSCRGSNDDEVGETVQSFPMQWKE